MKLGHRNENWWDKGQSPSVPIGSGCSLLDMGSSKQQVASFQVWPQSEIVLLS